jgi:hypothetical protein
LRVAPRSQAKQRKVMSSTEIKIIGRNEAMGTYFLNKVKGPDNKLHDGFEQYEIERGTEAAMRFSLISYQVKNLMAEILTTVEASIADERQLKAVKKLIKSQVHSKIDWIYEQCGCPEDEQLYLPEVLGE